MGKLPTGLVQAVQTARRRQGVDDDTYRSLLSNEFQVSSTKDLTPNQAGRLLDRWNKSSGKKVWTKAASRPDQRFLFVLWKQAYEVGAVRVPGKPGLRAFLEKRFGRSDPGMMEPAMTAKAAEAIKAMIARHQSKEAEHGHG